MSKHQSSFPDTWTLAKVAEVAEVLRGVTYKKQDASNEPRSGNVPILRATNIGQRLSFDELVWVPRAAVSSEQFLRTGDIVLAASSGSLSVVGKAAVLENEWLGGFGAFCMVVRPRPAFIAPRFLAYYFQTSGYRRRVSELAAGVNINNLRREHIESTSFPLPSRAEQMRIVSALDTQLTRLDAAVAALERVRANLKRYRASVLKAAVESRLVPTEAELARKEGRDYEPAPVLLDRILAERRRRWEESELARMKAAGKPPKDDRWKSKYKEPVAPDTSTLPQLPEGWCWGTLDALASVVGGVTKGQKRRPTEQLRPVPYLRVANVQRGYLDLSVIKEIEATEDEIKELRLEAGDVLFNEGGDRDKLGRGWVWNCEISECIHQNHVFRARLYTQDLLPKFLSWYGNSAAQLFFLQEGKQTTNLASLNSTNLKKLPVPLPPVAEQRRIVAEIDLSLSVVDATVKTTDAAMTRVNRLRQAILKWAFEGKLVDQDPSDEPASVLLERIRAERIAATPPKKSPKPHGEEAQTVK